MRREGWRPNSPPAARNRKSRARHATSPEQVAAALPVEAVLIDLFKYSHAIPSTGGKGPLRFERRLLAFVLRHSGPVALVPLGPARPITEAVRKWETAVSRAVRM